MSGLLEINIEIPQEIYVVIIFLLRTIAQRIRDASLDLPGGSVKTDAGEILIRMQERKDTGLDFAQIPIITTESGATILLGAIASITDGYEDTDYSARYNQSCISTALGGGLGKWLCRLCY